MCNLSFIFAQSIVVRSSDHIWGNVRLQGEIYEDSCHCLDTKLNRHYTLAVVTRQSIEMCLFSCRLSCTNCDWFNCGFTFHSKTLPLFSGCSLWLSISGGHQDCIDKWLKLSDFFWGDPRPVYRLLLCVSCFAGQVPKTFQLLRESSPFAFPLDDSMHLSTDLPLKLSTRSPLTS